ncbi:nadh dehydrogenase -like protein [Cordyceps javanica]|uniref:Nadh dehydrogenase-like protein n=1 Tax=Cordyceps javanica TaxID=43265 RepID=A0A545VGR4_9HYPO|nr:nadh dehydrogenase -like protein [Cordyceps javanica]
MRYEDWDILLFPRDGKVPLKEFKVACHVVHDNELSHIHGSLGLPTVCCFVPSLPTGAPYKLSIHSWSTPPISHFTRSCGKFADRVVFEVRLSSSMNRAGPWPNVLKNSFEISDNGELQSLNFPDFQRELLNQSYWSPADDLGRMKVVISESYPRDSLSVPFERLKNIGEGSKPPTFPYSDTLSLSNTVASDPFVEANAYFEWLSGIGMGLNSDTSATVVNPPTAGRANRKTSTDTSMPDYVSSTDTPPMIKSGHDDDFGKKINGDGDSIHMKVPTNTPTACELNITEAEGVHFTILPSNTPVSTGTSANTSFLGHSSALSPQLVPTPAMEVKSRKENKAKQLSTPPTVSTTISISGESTSVRRVSHQLLKSGSLVVTTGSVCESPSRHAIEDHEEPHRASPRVLLYALDEAAPK